MKEIEKTVRDEVLDNALDMRLGDNTAQKAITEALMTTLLFEFPHLMETMKIHLQMQADMHRQMLAKEDEPAKAAFERRIADTLQQLDLMQGH